MSPIHYQPDGWHFVDETGDLNGPYATEAEAIGAYLTYCQWLEGPSDVTTQKNHLRFIVVDMFE